MTRNEIAEKIIKHLPDKRYSILIGARQVGKTTVVKQVLHHLIQKKEKAFFITFEDPEILQAINHHPENIFRYAIHPRTLEKNERVILVIDEVQYAANPSNFLKLLYDTYNERVKIIATGSSAFYINRHFKDSLAGRKKIFELYSLNFEEFLHFKEQDILIPQLLELRRRQKFIGNDRHALDALFEEYLTYGGYPAVVLQKDSQSKKDLLQDMINSYMRKDVAEANIRDEIKFFQLVRLLAAQTGQLVNTNSLGNTLKLSSGAIENYLYLLRVCFHIHLLPPKYNNVTKELIKMPKVYFNDLGLRNVLLKQFGNINERLDKGPLLENYVYTRLRDLYTTDDLFFWRTADGNEVDFLVEEQYQKGLAYEVKFSESEFKPTKYKKFMSNYAAYNLSGLSYRVEKKSKQKEAIRL